MICLTFEFLSLSHTADEMHSEASKALQRLDEAFGESVDGVIAPGKRARSIKTAVKFAENRSWDLHLRELSVLQLSGPRTDNRLLCNLGNCKEELVAIRELAVYPAIIWMYRPTCPQADCTLHSIGFAAGTPKGKVAGVVRSSKHRSS